MIESHYWRQEILADLRWLRRKRKYQRWSERQVVLFERKLMLVAFQVRSLLERPKVAPKARRERLACTMYLKHQLSPPANVMDRFEFWFHFDLESPVAAQLSAEDICNQLIHHYLMTTEPEGTSFAKLWLYSDRKRGTCLYEIGVEDLIRYFAIFATDSSALTTGTITWNEKRLDYDLV